MSDTDQGGWTVQGSRKGKKEKVSSVSVASSSTAGPPVTVTSTYNHKFVASRFRSELEGLACCIMKHLCERNVALDDIICLLKPSSGSVVVTISGKVDKDGPLSGCLREVLGGEYDFQPSPAVSKSVSDWYKGFSEGYEGFRLGYLGCAEKKAISVLKAEVKVVDIIAFTGIEGVTKNKLSYVGVVSGRYDAPQWVDLCESCNYCINRHNGQ